MYSSVHTARRRNERLVCWVRVNVKVALCYAAPDEAGDTAHHAMVAFEQQLAGTVVL